jgi:glycosyltransferase involved in cell wall biosynthesis
MNKFLAVSWAFPPAIMPRSLQVSRTLKGLLEAGWQASVLTVDPRSIDRVVKTDSALGAEYEGLFPLTAVPSPEDWLPARLIWRLFPELSVMPDPRSVWIPLATSAGRRMLSQGGFSGIISFAQPWSDHLIARRLSAEFKLPWIAHFSDPWSDSPYYRTGGPAVSLRKKMELNTIRDANGVIFVSEETRDLVMRKYPPEWAVKTRIIPHCFEPALIPSSPNRKPHETGALKLTYTGGFYGHRTPINLFKAIVKLNKIGGLKDRLQVEIVGGGVEPYNVIVSEMGLDEIVKIRATVPYHESQQIASRADVLLVIDAPNPEVNVFLPSKLVEYLAFHKPIFGITPARGASADLLRSLGCPQAETEDIAAIASILADLISRKQAGRLTVAPEFEANTAKYDVRQTTRQYLELFETFFKQPSQRQ